MRHLPNALTIGRILLTPYLVWLLTHGRPMPATGIVFGFCGISDLADGFLARRFGWGSRLGEALDPVADKLFLMAMYAALYSTGLVPGWLAAIVLGKDLLQLLAAVLVFVFTPVRRFPADAWGKFCTFCQIMASLVVLAEGPDWLRLVTFAAVSVVTPATGIHYLLRGTVVTVPVKNVKAT